MTTFRLCLLLFALVAAVYLVAIGSAVVKRKTDTYVETHRQP